jgi:hypothetical protein
LGNLIVGISFRLPKAFFKKFLSVYGEPLKVGENDSSYEEDLHKLEEALNLLTLKKSRANRALG